MGSSSEASEKEIRALALGFVRRHAEDPPNQMMVVQALVGSLGAEKFYSDFAYGKLVGRARREGVRQVVDDLICERILQYDGSSDNLVVSEAPPPVAEHAPPRSLFAPSSSYPPAARSFSAHSAPLSNARGAEGAGESRGPAGAGASSYAAERPPSSLTLPEGQEDPEDVPLAPEQHEVYECAVSGRNNVFFTGSAGTGKSFLLRRIIRGLRERYSEADAVFVTAPTGIAACNVGGTTIHSFAGIGRGDGTPDALATAVARKPIPAARWRAARVLVVDEVSMLDASLLDTLNLIAQRVRGNRKPFGGIQMMCVGWSCQVAAFTCRQKVKHV